MILLSHGHGSTLVGWKWSSQRSWRPGTARLESRGVWTRGLLAWVDAVDLGVGSHRVVGRWPAARGACWEDDGDPDSSGSGCGRDCPLDGTARNTMQTKVSKLRRALGDAAILSGGRAGYSLGVEPSAVDALEVLSVAEEATAHLNSGDLGRVLELCANALAMFRGDVPRLHETRGTSEPPTNPGRFRPMPGAHRCRRPRRGYPLLGAT